MIGRYFLSSVHGFLRIGMWICALTAHIVFANDNTSMAITQAFLKEIVLHAEAFSSYGQPLPKHLHTHIATEALQAYASTHSKHRALLEEFHLQQSTVFERIEQQMTHEDPSLQHWNLEAVRTLTNSHAAMREFMVYHVTLKPMQDTKDLTTFPFIVISLTSQAQTPMQMIDFEELRGASCPKKSLNDT